MGALLACLTDFGEVAEGLVRRGGKPGPEPLCQMSGLLGSVSGGMGWCQYGVMWCWW